MFTVHTVDIQTWQETHNWLTYIGLGLNIWSSRQTLKMHFRQELGAGHESDQTVFLSGIHNLTK